MLKYSCDLTIPLSWVSCLQIFTKQYVISENTLKNSNLTQLRKYIEIQGLSGHTLNDLKYWRNSFLEIAIPE